MVPAQLSMQLRELESWKIKYISHDSWKCRWAPMTDHETRQHTRWGLAMQEQHAKRENNNMGGMRGCASRVVGRSFSCITVVMFLIIYCLDYTTNNRKECHFLMLISFVFFFSSSRSVHSLLYFVSLLQSTASLR